MNQPNIYAPRHWLNYDVVDMSLTEALSDALDLKDLVAGWSLISAQLKLYDLIGSDSESIMLSDYTAGFEGMKALDEYVNRNM